MFSKINLSTDYFKFPVIFSAVFFSVILFQALTFSSNDGIVSVVKSGMNCSISYNDELRVQLSLNDRYFYRGDDVCIEFIVTNVSDYLIKLLYPSSNRFKLEIFNEDKLVFSDISGDFGASFLSIYNLRSGESIIYKVKWKQIGDDKKFVAPGYYTLKMTLVANPYIESGLVGFYIED